MNRQPQPDALQPPDFWRRLTAGLTRWPLVTTCAVIAIIVLIVFLFRGVARHEFVNLDDTHYITRNVHLQAFTRENAIWILTDRSLYWHPLTYLVHATENVLWGSDAGKHHLTSVALHCLNVLGIFCLGVMVLATSRPNTGEDNEARRDATVMAASFAAAVLFGLHPLRVETVAWAAAKKDLLVTLFTVLTLTAYLAFGSAAESRTRLKRYWITLALFMLALMSKPVAVTVPASLMLLDVFPLRRLRRVGDLRARLREKIPFFALALIAVSLSLTGWKEQARRYPREVLAAAPQWVRAIRTIWGTAFGIVKTAWPADLVPYYPLPLPENDGRLTPRTLAAALVLLALTAFCIWMWRRGRRFWLVVWLIYLVSVAPVSGFRQLAAIETADRFTYLPSVPIFLLIGAGIFAALDRLLERHAVVPAAVSVATVCVAVVSLGVLTQRQLPLWQDSESMWLRVIEVYPDRVFIAHTNLGAVYHHHALRDEDRTWLDRAEAQYRTALEIAPGHVTALNNLGLVYESSGKFREAEQSYLQAVRIAPMYSLCHANLAHLYVKMDRRDRAALHYRKAVETGGYVDESFLAELRRGLQPEADTEE